MKKRPDSSGDIHELISDAGWSWFHEPRIAQFRGSVWFGAVSSGWRDEKEKGEVVAVEWTISQDKIRRHVLRKPHSAQESAEWADDHSAPAILPLPSGEILAAYSLHGLDNQIRFRRYFPSLGFWSKERVFSPSVDSRVTYSNLVYLSRERRVYNFFRGLDNSWKPSWAYSDTNGRSWANGGLLIDFPHLERHRPYLKVNSNGVDIIHFAYTDGHPRDFDNSVYHVAYRAGFGLTTTAGKLIAPLDEGLSSPDEGTVVFRGSASKVAWLVAVNDYGPRGLFILYSLRRREREELDDAEVSRIEYFIALWNGLKWVSHFVASAGPQLYKGEDDYSGLFSQDSDDPRVVYISTRVCPMNQRNLANWHIFRGETKDWISWRWHRISGGESGDNIRPISVGMRGAKVLWLSGQYSSFKSYGLRVLGKSLEDLV